MFWKMDEVDPLLHCKVCNMVQCVKDVKWKAVCLDKKKKSNGGVGKKMK